jgi:hypothetical protein
MPHITHRPIFKERHASIAQLRIVPQLEHVIILGTYGSRLVGHMWRACYAGGLHSIPTCAHVAILYRDFGTTNKVAGNPLLISVRAPRQLIFCRRASWHTDICVVIFSKPSHGEGACITVMACEWERYSDKLKDRDLSCTVRCGILVDPGFHLFFSSALTISIFFSRNVSPLWNGEEAVWLSAIQLTLVVR